LNGWLLDTNVIASLSAPGGAPSVKTWANAQDEARLYLSVITLAEFDKGIAQLAEDDPNRVRHAANRDAIAARFGRRVLPVSDAVMRLWGSLAGRIKRETGRRPPVIDTLLAATAIEHKLLLVTRNTADVRHTGATVVNPWVDDLGKFLVTRR
jgi:predicted nucleic acid-binding protein